MRLLATTFAVVPLLFTATAASAGWICGSCKPRHCCAPVRYACCPKHELQTVEKSCFDIEQEAICVPKVKLPWQSCSTPRRARLVVVNRLKSRSYECGQRCVLVWEARQLCGRCGKPAVVESPSAPAEGTENESDAAPPDAAGEDAGGEGSGGEKFTDEPRPKPADPEENALYFPGEDPFSSALRGY